MGEHAVHEINDLLSHVAPLFLRVFQQNRPMADITAATHSGRQKCIYSLYIYVEGPFREKDFNLSPVDGG